MSKESCGALRRFHVVGTAIVVTTLLFASSCHDSKSFGRSKIRLPDHFTLVGGASSVEADGTTVECLFDLVFDLSLPPINTPDFLEYHGTHGGEMWRTVLDASGDGIALGPHVFGEVVVRSYRSRVLEIIIPVNQDDETPFYREFARLEGYVELDQSATGTWSCAPLNTRGDTQYTAAGTWELIP
jgi:hypothetical protein